jgi:Polyketide cyclase / dehydrase and lipid transport
MMTATAIAETETPDMARVYVSTVIEASPAQVWRRVRDFNALPEWTPFVVESRIEQHQPADRVGCIRNFTMRDGGHIREQLLALSDYEMSCTYAMLESPMPVENYIATLSLLPVTEGNVTFAQWQADFECPPERENDLVRQIGMGVFQTAFDHLKQQMAGR